MTRLNLLLVLVCVVAIAGQAPARASAAEDAGPNLDDLTVRVAAPFKLTIRDRSWNGDPHADPAGRAVLERTDGRLMWDLSDVTEASASADGSTVALLTSDYEVHVSRLPDSPRRVAGGPYLGPALSRDGKSLVAQRLGEGTHILEKTSNTQGIALVNLESGRDRLVLEGNDLYGASFATDQKIFFGTGGEEGVASLYLLDLTRMSAARVTNRAKGARQGFPSQPPQLVGGAITYRSDDEQIRVAEPAATDFGPVRRYEAPQFVAGDVSPNFGPVRIRRPTTQTTKKPPVMNYYDLDKRTNFIEDWNCAKMTYDGHLGTDFTQDMGWDVVAPAAGLVFWRYDGCANTNSKGCGLGFGNFAALEHSDGTVSHESHGKKWTIPEKGVRLSCGDKLMESAASGNAGGVFHTHHETWVNPGAHKNKSLRYDPFKGSCDPTDPSKWTSQNGYRSLPGTSCSN